MAERTVPTSAAPQPEQHEATRSGERFATPPVDIYEDERGLVVVADVPGADPGTVDVRVERGVLTMQAPSSTTQPVGNPVYCEYELTGFYRQFELPEEVDSAGIHAELKDGVLTLHLPRVAPAQPRRIEVRTG